METQIRRVVWSFAKDEINADGIYQGEDRRVYNFISDSFKVDVRAGHRLHLCAHKTPESNDEVCAHFMLVGNGKHADCSCGACGYMWEFAEDKCDSACKYKK